MRSSIKLLSNYCVPLELKVFKLMSEVRNPFYEYGQYDAGMGTSLKFNKFLRNKMVRIVTACQKFSSNALNKEVPFK